MRQTARDMQTIFIRIPVADHKALAALAEREERSMSAQVRFAIKTMLNASTPQAQELAAEDLGEEEHPF